jgi:hypothetical protein
MESGHGGRNLAKGGVKRNPENRKEGATAGRPRASKTYAALSIGQVAVWTIQACNGLAWDSFNVK